MPKKATEQSADVVARIDAQIQGVIAAIDTQISQLEAKKTTLLTLFGEAEATARRGRPTSTKKASAAPANKPAKKRPVSEETRRLLGEKKREYWAKIRAEKSKSKGGSSK
jgi:hypothetical protein